MKKKYVCCIFFNTTVRAVAVLQSDTCKVTQIMAEIIQTDCFLHVMDTYMNIIHHNKHV